MRVTVSPHELFQLTIMRERIYDFSMHNHWWSYITHLTNGASVNDIQEKSGIGPSVLSHWKNGRYKPKADMAVSLARAYGGSPVEALIAAEYLAPEEAGAVKIARRVTDMSDDELTGAIQDFVREISNRLLTREDSKSERLPGGSENTDTFFFKPGNRGTTKSII